MTSDQPEKSMNLPTNSRCFTQIDTNTAVTQLSPFQHFTSTFHCTLFLFVKLTHKTNYNLKANLKFSRFKSPHYRIVASALLPSGGNCNCGLIVALGREVSGSATLAQWSALAARDSTNACALTTSHFAPSLPDPD